MTNINKARSARRWTARRAIPSLAAAALAAGTLATVSPAAAYNYVPAGEGDRWGVHDAANPGLDTGSVRDTTGNALQGYGGLRVEVEGGKSRLNGILLRGFGLTYDGRETFTSTRGVDVDGVVVRRELVVPAGQSYGRFFDTFTNTTRKPVTVRVAFGGQVGYATGENQSELSATGDGDDAITAADGWASWHTPTTAAGGPSQNGPSATVFGTPGEADALEKVGTFLLDPFDNPLPADGDAANHPGFVTTLTIEPGDTESLLRYVVTGMPEGRAVGGSTRPAGSEVAKVESLAATLAGLPAVEGLTLSELCSVENFDPAALGLAGADCAKAPQVPFAGSAAGSVSAKTAATTSSYDVVGKTLTELAADLKAGRTTSQQIVRAYLDRIAAYDQGPFGLHSVITVAPDAMAQARAADKARKAGDKRPLLGIPVLAKDIIDTKDMPTTGGSLVFDGYQPKEDAFQVELMREAGAIILGKANLAEFANDGHYSPNAFGATWNAFDPSRSPIGSSGGSAVAVASSFAAAAWGTQTGDSLWGPAGAASLYSLRGTDGMQSSAGTMPLTLIQDYVGWIGQSIEDLATLLDVTAVDNPDDVLDDVANGHRPTDWSATLKPGALKGKVIGVPETAFDDPFGTSEVSDALKAQFANFEKAGATIKVVPDFTDVPTRGDYGDTGYEGWAQWIDAHPDNPYTLPEQITHNELRVPYQRRAGEYTGTGRMTEQQQRDFEAYRATYRENIAAWMDEHGADAILYPAELSEIHLNDSINPSFGRKDPQSSAAGVPTVIFPAGTTENGNPVGFQLQGKAFQDAELMGFAYAFDKVAQGRVLPAWTPPLRYDADAVPPPVVDVDPLPEPQPTKLRLTVLDRSVKATLPRRGKARVTLAVGCASVGAACTGTVKVTLGGKRIATSKVRVAAGGQRTITIALPAKATTKVRKGKKVTLKVAFTGTGRTVSSTPVKVTVRR
ncbi:amidase [Nocardioides sp. zg-579]|uniref:Amidase n=1 Tax=Nocardioides marmotae TaxID=2663857 RepID=A0A6I3J4N7_9ACTN|nr:amidase [Nocardioides marmotae]MCR6030360.1 amidase [Gordonia jinghuaiqii]MTB93994.1 amidase [Nocardioides marmotae]QKE00309.1 amidase [Nocardioides marmotae]